MYSGTRVNYISRPGKNDDAQYAFELITELYPGKILYLFTDIGRFQ